MVAVSRDHRLAEKKQINIEDLHGETLMMVGRGDSGVNDFIRNDLEKTIRRYTLRTLRSFTIYLYLTAVPKAETFCLPLNAGKMFTPDLYQFP